MRISKIMVALLVSVMAVTAMTGVAVADQINVYEPNTFVAGIDGAASGTGVASIQLTPGGAGVIKDLEVWAFNQQANTVHTLTTGVAPMPGCVGCTANDIIVTYSEKTAPCAGACGVFAAGPKNWVQDMAAQVMPPPVGNPTVSESLDVKFVAAPGVTAGNSYQVQIEDNNGLTYTCAVTIVATTVPEFATIAIPAIAVLGLFLFFNKRKHKKA